MAHRAFITLLSITIVAIPWVLLNFEYRAHAERVEQTALGNAKVYARASHQFRQFYIDQVMPAAKLANMDVVMDVHTQPDALPLAYTAAIDIGLDAYSPEFGGAYFISEHPWRHREPPTIEEAHLWSEVVDSGKPAHLTYEEAERTWLLYGTPIFLDRAFCVDCHNTHPATPKTGWSIGDLRGVEVVKLSLAKPTAHLLMPNPATTAVGLIAMAICLMAIFAVERARRSRIEDQIQFERGQAERLALISGGVAHHFNNLLAVVLGRADLLEHRLGEQQEIAYIRQSVKHGADLVDKLRRAAKNQPVALEKVNLITLVEQQIARFHNHLDVTPDVSLPDQATLVIDRVSAEFMIGELISNAFEHARSVVKIALSVDGMTPVFSVTNDCRAAPDLELASLPFYTTLGPGRTGLGLAAVQGMAEKLDAKFCIAASDEQVTATLTFAVKAAVAHGAARHVSSTKSATIKPPSTRSSTTKTSTSRPCAAESLAPKPGSSST